MIIQDYDSIRFLASLTMAIINDHGQERKN